MKKINSKREDSLYRLWIGMKSRCGNKNSPWYKNYGGRGITVCNEWLNSFETFKKDMGERPEGYSLERKNNDLGYFKENCCWSSRSVQSHNQRKRKLKSHSKYRGVTFFNRQNGKKKWVTIIRKDKKRVFMKYFLTEIEAAKCYDEMAKKYYGDSASLNFKKES